MAVDQMTDATCVRHPSVATLLTCTRCERPACPDCLVHGAVGAHCVDCLTHQRANRSAAERRADRAERRCRRPGVVFWSVVAAFLAGCVACAMGSDLLGLNGYRLTGFLTIFLGWIVSLCLHEYGHALAAFRFGDDSVVDKGYLTLDPRRYSDPLMSVVFPVGLLLLGGIPFPGGAVWIDESRIRTRERRAMVSTAGPLANALFAVVLLVPIGLGAYSAVPGLIPPLAFLGVLQLLSVIVNLLPIPGLDGYGVIEPYLPDSIAGALRPLRVFGFLLLFALLARSPMGAAVWDAGTQGMSALGVEPVLAALGDALFMPDLTGSR